ncbi:hypothetical protein ACIQ9J_36425 [Streptomyces sp. NPDC094153]|uniref:hypothetical protein n=1 Tax=Streptomyces sp. NPDC094153 TaxID=3366058 RepID=UPI0037FA4816
MVRAIGVNRIFDQVQLRGQKFAEVRGDGVIELLSGSAITLRKPTEPWGRGVPPEVPRELGAKAGRRGGADEVARGTDIALTGWSEEVGEVSPGRDQGGQ